MSEHELTLTVDGERERLVVEGRTLLVHALREELGVTAPKVGCETSKCGACTVLLDGDAVKSCTVLAAQADGSEVTTAAGLADATDAAASDDGLSAVQESFREEHGLQCGYCTPGMVTTTTAFLRKTPDPDESEIRSALKGNICRCTGYHNVVRAVETAAGKRQASAGERDAEGETDRIEAASPEVDD